MLMDVVDDNLGVAASTYGILSNHFTKD